MYKGLGHYAIRTSNIDQSLHFYQNILGFEEAFRMNDENGDPWIIYLSIVPGQFIELFMNGTKPADRGDDVIGVTHICLEVDDVEKSCETLRAKGAPIDREIAFGRSRAKQFWTHDPDGNPIEIMELPPESQQAQAIQRMLTARKNNA